MYVTFSKWIVRLEEKIEERVGKNPYKNPYVQLELEKKYYKELEETLTDEEL